MTISNKKPIFALYMNCQHSFSTTKGAFWTHMQLRQAKTPYVLLLSKQAAESPLYKELYGI